MAGLVLTSSDDSKCAVTKMVIRKFGWTNRNFLVKMSFRNWSPAFAIEMCSGEFSLKHDLG